MPRCPFAIWDPIEKPDGGFWSNPLVMNPPSKIIHHKTQGSSYPRTTYVNGGSIPHFTVSYDKIWQHFDTLAASRALYNATGGVSPNSDGTIQIEAIGFSGEEDLTVAQNVASLCEWIEQTHGIPNVWPMGRPPQAGALNPAPDDVWLNQPGHYAHSQAPENIHAHWDPAYTDGEWETVNKRRSTPSVEVKMTSPIGRIDVVEDAGAGKLRVAGWALDPDTPSDSITVHLYVNGVLFSAEANIDRPDVNEVMSVTGRHGFDTTIQVPMKVEVALYGLDSSGDASSNAYLGSSNVAIRVGAAPTTTQTAPDVSAIVRAELKKLFSGL